MLFCFSGFIYTQVSLKLYYQLILFAKMSQEQQASMSIYYFEAITVKWFPLPLEFTPPLQNLMMTETSNDYFLFSFPK